MIAAGDMAGDRHVVRLVGENEAGRGGPPSINRARDGWFGRIAANDPVIAEREDVAHALATAFAPGSGASGPASDLQGAIVQNYLINFVEGEAGDLDRSVHNDQLLELNLEFADIPGPLFAEPINGKPECPLLRLAQMPDKSKIRGILGRPRSFAASTRASPSRTILSLPTRTGSQKPSALTEAAISRTCAGSSLRISRAGIAQLVKRNVGQGERRQQVVADRPRRRRRVRQSAKVSSPLATLRPQLIRERAARRHPIAKIFHLELLTLECIGGKAALDAVRVARGSNAKPTGILPQ